jgi:hypothetical protein
MYKREVVSFIALFARQMGLIMYFIKTWDNFSNENLSLVIDTGQQYVFILFISASLFTIK